MQGAWGETKDKADDVWEGVKDKVGDVVDGDDDKNTSRTASSPRRSIASRGA